MNQITDPLFWRAVGKALIRTALAALAPVIPLIIGNPLDPQTWLYTVMLVGFAVLLAIATALAGLPDATGNFLVVAVQRAARQAGQVLLAATAGQVLLSDLNWDSVIRQVLIAAFTTIVLAAVQFTEPATEVLKKVEAQRDGLVVPGEVAPGDIIEE